MLFNLSLGKGWVLKATHRSLYARERDPNGWTSGQSGQVRKIAPSPRFESWSVHPVGSRYTDFVIQANKVLVRLNKCQCRRKSAVRAVLQSDRKSFIKGKRIIDLPGKNILDVCLTVM